MRSSVLTRYRIVHSPRPRGRTINYSRPACPVKEVQKGQPLLVQGSLAPNSHVPTCGGCLQPVKPAVVDPRSCSRGITVFCPVLSCPCPACALKEAFLVSSSFTILVLYTEQYGWKRVYNLTPRWQYYSKYPG